MPAAMLTVEDEAFWEGLAPVTFGQLPRLQDQVTVIGYAVLHSRHSYMPVTVMHLWTADVTRIHKGMLPVIV